MKTKAKFEKLPIYMQEKIKNFLLANNFPAAKALYEQWLMQQAHEPKFGN